MKKPPVRLTYRLLSYLLSALLAGQPLLPAVAATLTPVGGASADKAANGVPVVNIATPNGAGISHNPFQDYNVGKEGLILNNASGKLNQTQLAGLVNGNPNLKAGKEAKAIINEVTGGNRSQLQGYTEVAGKAANVIVANPYGITCSGCGFINTPQATLTTGKPVFDASGSLQALDVKKGSITVEGEGVDAKSSDALAVISRAVEVNAAVHAKALTVIAGANRVGTDGSVRAQQGEGAVPVVAVDTGALGGMYANSIHLVSSEKGVGVNLGNLDARQGDIVLDANGKLSVHTSLASGALSATGQNITLSGNHKASGPVTLNSQGDMALSNGSLTSDGDLVLTAHGALSHSNEKLTAGRDVALTAKDITQDAASGTDAARHISLNAGGDVTTQGKITAGQNVTLTAGSLHHRGQLVAGNALSVNAAQQTLSGAINATGDVSIQGQSLTTTAASQIQGQNLSLTADRAELKGTQAAKNSLTVSAQTVSHSGKSSGASVRFSTPELNNSGVLFGSQSLTLKGTTLSNSGKLFSGGEMTAELASLSGAGQLAALGNLALKFTRSVSTEGVIAAGKQLSVTSQGDIRNGGTLQGNGITLNAAGLLSNNGQLIAGSGSTSLTGQQIVMNAGGTLQASGDVSLTSQSDITLNGFTGTAGNLLLNATGSIINTALLYAGNNLSLFADSIQNLRGSILADNNLLMQKDASGAANTEVINSSGNIETTHGDITIKTGHLLNTRDGLAVTRAVSPGSSSGTLTPLPSDKWWEFGPDGNGNGLYLLVRKLIGLQPEPEYRLQTGDKEVVTITARGDAGRIASGAGMTINAGSLENEAASILANNDMRLQGSTLNNQSWQEGTSVNETVWTLDSNRSHRYVCGAYECEGYSQTSRQLTTPNGQLYRGTISAGGSVSANFASDISNTTATANAGKISNTLAAPALTTPSAQNISGDGSNGYFITSTDPNSPYLITVNPKLNGLGQLDPSLFADLYKLLGMSPGSAPRETNSRYTDVNQYLGSSYMLNRLALNPDKNYRFLGDAAFDTRYVSNAVLNQTGARYINGVGSDLEQMRYLMDRAAEAQRALGLQFGVTLTADQVAALGHSILWWESATVNGQTVLVPKLYLLPKDVTVRSGSVIDGNNLQLTGGNITNSGSTLVAQNNLNIDSSTGISNLDGGLIRAGGGLDLSAQDDINNIGSTLSGKTVQLDSTGGSINNLTRTQQWSVSSNSRKGNVFISGTDVGQTAAITAVSGLQMGAARDITFTGATASAGRDLFMRAGNDLNLNAVTRDETSRMGNSETHHRSAERSTVTAGDNVALIAGRDITSQAAGIVAENNVALQAGRDVNLLAEATVDGSSSRSSKKTLINESVRQQATEIASGGNTTMIAGRDVNSEAAQVTASGNIGVAAGRDVNLSTATESDYHYREETKTKSGFLSKKTTHTIEEDSATREAGTLLSGSNVQVQAGNNLLVKGSSVVADDVVNVKAGNNVDIVAATNTDSSWRFKQEKKSGLMGTGGIGITLGSSKTTHSLREAGTTQSQSFSTVGSTGGSVIISAGNQAHVGGADLIAGKDLRLSGSSVIIEPGHDKRRRDETFEQQKSGLTLALSGTVGSAINNAVTAAQDTREESDGRLKALQATKTALSGVQAGQAAAAAPATADPNAMGVSLSLSTQKSKSQQHAESDAVAGSTLNAGNNLFITANGKNQGPDSGDIVIAGSQLKAGSHTQLSAENDILLSGAASTQKTSGKNSSSGGGVGVSIGAGGNGAGISVFASVNAAKGNDKGNGSDWTETTIDSGKTVTLNSGRDTVLDGAQVNGNNIIADVGRDLLMKSRQDTNQYDSKQTSMAAGGSFTFGSMTGSGYISASQDKMKSRFDSVAEQTGLYAGKGGFDITVGNHTQLDGAVIASTATADKNRLDTGTLGFSDIHNEADFKTQHSGISLSGGGSFGGNFQGNMPGGIISAAGNSGHQEGTTQAAVANGTIILRDKANQQQDVTSLSRDTEHANDSINPIFDKEKEQNRLKEIGLISDIGGQAADIARTQGDINALNAAKDKYGNLPANATEEQRQAWLASLRNSQIYKDEMAKYGTGSDMQRGIQAATAALQGLAGGNIGGALAGASAPELANFIGHQAGIDDNTAAKAIAHALLGGVTAALQGNSAAAGAAGAVTGELAAKAIAKVLYPDVKELSALSEEQKQTLSTLASISAGMAGGLAGGDTAGMAAGAGAGRNSAENNYLSEKESRQLDKEMQECKASGGDCNKVVEKYINISNKNSKELVEACTGGGVACVTWQELIQGATNVANDANPSQIRLDEKLKDPSAAALVNYLNGTDLKFLQDNITQGDRIMSVISDPTSWPVAIMGGKAIITNSAGVKEQLIAAGVSSAANAAIQYGTSKTGEVKLSDVIGAGVIGLITAGKGYNPTVTWNATGGYYQAKINGDDPFMGALLSKTGASVGYVAGNIIKVPFDKKLNPISKQYEWVPTGVWTITKPAPQNNLPSLSGNVADSAASGWFSDALQNSIKNKDNSNVNK